MKKFSILALALALCAAMFTGCTGTLTDETGNTSDTGSVTTTAPTSKPTTAPTTAPTTVPTTAPTTTPTETTGGVNTMDPSGSSNGKNGPRMPGLG